MASAARSWRGLLLAAGLAIAPGGAAADGEVHVLDSARVLLDPSSTPPPDVDPRWTTVSLPDRWRETRPGAGGFAWYRFEVPGPARGSEPFALWIPEANMNAAALVNGAAVGSGGRFEPTVAHNFNRPLYFVVPAELLARERNAVDVRLYAEPHHNGALGVVLFGPDALLRPQHELRRRLQVDLSEVATVLALLTVLVAGAFWMGTRFDPVYGLFALTALFWSVASLNYWLRDVPLSFWTWERIVHGALDWFAVSLAIWTHRLTGIRRPRVERALLGYGVAATLLVVAIPVPYFYPWVNAAHVLALAIGAYATWVVWRRIRDFRPWERATYVVGGGLGLVFASHDLAIQMGWRDPGGPYMLAYLLPLVMLAFGTTLTGRFVTSLGEAERLNRELEDRVREKQAELEIQFERLREIERARLLSHERERIMREMHDGLGGRLASTLSMVELGRGGPGDVAAALRGALDDIRLVVDSLDPEVRELPELLGMLRARLEPLLRRAGLRLDWKVGSVPPLRALGPEGYLHVLRIVQEAVTNVVKHAGASEVTLTTTVVDRPEPCVRIEIRDDGVGIDAGAVSGGRGLHNMRERARRIGGGISVTAEASGTVVVLALPQTEPAAIPGSGRFRD